MALSDSGRAIVVYDGKARVFDGATWGPEETIEPSGVTMSNVHPVAVDPLGNGLVSFAGSSGMWVVEYNVASGWSPAKSLGTAAAGRWTDIAMNASGDTAVAYCEASDKLVAAFRPAGAVNWKKKAVGTNCCNSSAASDAPPVRASVSDTGDAMVIGSLTRVCSMRYDHNTGWGSAVVLDPGGGDTPSVAMNESGDAVAAWKLGFQASLRRYEVGTGWSAIATGPFGVSSGGMRVGMKDDVAALVYSAFPNVNYVLQDSTGAVTAPATISSLPGLSYYLDVASTAQGLGLVAWNQGEDLWAAHRAD